MHCPTLLLPTQSKHFPVQLWYRNSWYGCKIPMQGISLSDHTLLTKNKNDLTITLAAFTWKNATAPSTAPLPGLHCMRFAPPVCAGVAATVLVYGMTLVDHALLTAGLSPHQPLAGITEEGRAALLDAVHTGEGMLDGFYSQPPKGYIWQIPQGASDTPGPRISPTLERMTK